MSTLSIAKSRNPKSAASKKRSVKSSATARRKVTSTATTAKVLARPALKIGLERRDNGTASRIIDIICVMQVMFVVRDEKLAKAPEGIAAGLVFPSASVWRRGPG